MSPRDAVRKFGPELLEKLPLDNEYFLKRADQVGLLPSGVEAAIKAKGARHDKVAYYLDHVLKPGANEYLPILLNAYCDECI